jgi:hypothetical protein
MGTGYMQGGELNTCEETDFIRLPSSMTTRNDDEELLILYPDVDCGTMNVTTPTIQLYTNHRLVPRWSRVSNGDVTLGGVTSYLQALQPDNQIIVFDLTSLIGHPTVVYRTRCCDTYGTDIDYECSRTYETVKSNVRDEYRAVISYTGNDYDEVDKILPLMRRLLRVFEQYSSAIETLWTLWRLLSLDPTQLLKLRLAFFLIVFRFMRALSRFKL